LIVVVKAHERFSGENLERNEKLRQGVFEIAERKKCSFNQLAIAWVHHKGKDVVPIPGTIKRENQDSNIGAVHVKLTGEEMAKLEAVVPTAEIAGERYDAGHLRTTWRDAQSPPLSSWKQ
jgi:aryl-alcohol dehydrogenase-like predicted oxidoreductase